MGIFVVDGSGKVRMWNDWLAKHARVTTDQALGKRRTSFLASAERRFHDSNQEHPTIWLSPAVLSNALHRARSLCTQLTSLKPIRRFINRSRSPHSNLNDGQRCALIQVSDSSTSIKREKCCHSLGSLKKDATTDILTGLYNRRFFDEHYKIAIGQAIRQKMANVHLYGRHRLL